MFYSNCLLEVIKAKIKNPQIKIILIPPWKNEVKSPHFMWMSEEKVYDFGVKKYLKPHERLWFCGEIREHSVKALYSYYPWLR